MSPFAPSRQCAKTGCGQLTSQRYCTTHRTEHERDRLHETPWRSWYSTPTWKAIRLACLKRDGYRCQCEDCQGRYVLPPATVAHHLRPHRGSWELFASLENTSARSKRCHDRATANEIHSRKAPLGRICGRTFPGQPQARGSDLNSVHSEPEAL